MILGTYPKEKTVPCACLNFHLHLCAVSNCVRLFKLQLQEGISRKVWRLNIDLGITGLALESKRALAVEVVLTIGQHLAEPGILARVFFTEGVNLTPGSCKLLLAFAEKPSLSVRIQDAFALVLADLSTTDSAITVHHPHPTAAFTWAKWVGGLVQCQVSEATLVTRTLALQGSHLRYGGHVRQPSKIDDRHYIKSEKSLGGLALQEGIIELKISLVAVPPCGHRVPLTKLNAARSPDGRHTIIRAETVSKEEGAIDEEEREEIPTLAIALLRHVQDKPVA